MSGRVKVDPRKRSTAARRWRRSGASGPTSRWWIADAARVERAGGVGRRPSGTACRPGCCSADTTADRCSRPWRPRPAAPLTYGKDAARRDRRGGAGRGAGEDGSAARARRGPGGRDPAAGAVVGAGVERARTAGAAGFRAGPLGAAGRGGAVPRGRARSRPTRSGSTRSWGSPTARPRWRRACAGSGRVTETPRPPRRVDAARVSRHRAAGRYAAAAAPTIRLPIARPITRFTMAIATAAAIGSPPSSGTTTAAAVDRPMIQPR